MLNIRKRTHIVASMLFFSIACRTNRALDGVLKPIVCESCESWNQPQRPFRIHGNTYYVGVTGLSSILIATSRGLILLDGALPQSVPLIEENIESLGFHVKDIKYILNSHAHFDHAGGIAALQRDSGATVVASKRGAEVLQRGTLSDDDPQFASTPQRFHPIKDVLIVSDKGIIQLDQVLVTAHRTPGHTPGGTTWAWRSCEKNSCLNIVYADSLSAISADNFYFTGDKKTPDISHEFYRSIDKVAALPCDILVTVHPDSSDVFEKLEQRDKHPAINPFIDKQACVSYGNAARTRLQKRLQSEHNSKSTWVRKL